MSDEQSKTGQGLGWRFWLVMFTPAFVSLTGAAALLPLHKGVMGVFYLNLCVALPLNFFCSNWAAKQIVLLRDIRGGSSPWMFLWGPFLFFLNVAIVFGGCALMQDVAR